MRLARRQIKTSLADLSSSKGADDRKLITSPTSAGEKQVAKKDLRAPRKNVELTGM